MTTYKELYDEALALIKAQCTNVTNFAGLPSSIKSGYTYNDTKNRITMRYTISNPVSEMSSSAFDALFQTSMTNHGIYGKLSSEVTPRGVYNFYKALIAFCTANIRICCSQLLTTKYIICVSGTETSVTSITEGDKITTTEAVVLSKDIVNIMMSTAKPYYVRYTTSWVVS